MLLQMLPPPIASARSPLHVHSLHVRRDSFRAGVGCCPSKSRGLYPDFPRLREVSLSPFDLSQKTQDACGFVPVPEFSEEPQAFLRTGFCLQQVSPREENVSKSELG